MPHLPCYCYFYQISEWSLTWNYTASILHNTLWQGIRVLSEWRLCVFFIDILWYCTKPSAFTQSFADVTHHNMMYLISNFVHPLTLSLIWNLAINANICITWMTLWENIIQYAHCISPKSCHMLWYVFWNLQSIMNCVVIASFSTSRHSVSSCIYHTQAQQITNLSSKHL